MASKRKRVVLSLADKLKIIEESDKGVPGKKLAEMYGVGHSTISDIKSSKHTLLNFVSVLENNDGRKSMKAATNKHLEDVIFDWFLEQRSLGSPISGPILCEKAKMLAVNLGYSSFKASNGWLRNFKSRHGVRESDLSGEKLADAAEEFTEKFQVLADPYDPECLYNADVWKDSQFVDCSGAFGCLRSTRSLPNECDLDRTSVNYKPHGSEAKMASGYSTDLTLINLVKEREILWNSTLRVNRRTDVKRTVWAEVAAELGPEFTGEMAFKRFAHLRDNFNKNRRKVEETTLSGDGDVFIPKWPLYSALEFLKSGVKHVQDPSNLPEVLTVDAESDTSFSTPEPSPFPPYVERAKRKFSSIAPEKIDDILQIMSKPPEEPKRDEVDTFVALVATKLRSLERKKRSQVEKQILDILYEADND